MRKTALPRLSKGWGVGVADWSLSWMWRGVRSLQVGRTGLEGAAWATSAESCGGVWVVVGGCLVVMGLERLGTPG